MSFEVIDLTSDTEADESGFYSRHLRALILEIESESDEPASDVGSEFGSPKKTKKAQSTTKPDAEKSSDGKKRAKPAAAKKKPKSTAEVHPSTGMFYLSCSVSFKTLTVLLWKKQALKRNPRARPTIPLKFRSDDWCKGRHLKSHA